MECELQIKRRSTAAHETPEAWFIPGSDCALWVDEICRWRTPQEGLKLFLVPAEPGGREARGLLVIPPANGRPNDARAFPLAALEGKLYLPVDAELHPPLAPAEIQSLIPWEAALIHPGIGLVAFDEEDALQLWELLDPPAAAGGNWNAARAGAALSSTLHGIVLAAMPELGDMFGDAAKEIGTEPPVNLPKKAGEPSAGPGSRAARALRGMGASAIQKLMSLLPKRPRGGRTWVNDVMDWASAKMTKVTDELEALRNRELLRLMQLLESDPEQGLRHALPLGGSAGRGRATPGGRLGTRDIRFNMGRLGGGRPSDQWDVPGELRTKLILRYRELALREKQLGRFQRAAYIFAELLGDLSAAAAVLKEGKRFAEAAILYRDHLKQPRAAAECFAEGGLFAEAIAIYESEKDFLACGDLYRKLAVEEKAIAAYRKAVGAKAAGFDFIGAAQILEDRIHAPGEALVELRKGWPGSPQAALCLGGEFALIGRMGDHDVAMRRLAELRDERTLSTRVISLAKVLRTVRETYPDQRARRVAADMARVKLSGAMAAGDAADLRAATEILSSLAREDRLLAGDASRYLNGRLQILAKKTPPPLPAPSRKPGSGRLGSPIPARTFKLGNVTAVSCVKRCGDHFIAVAQTRSQSPPRNLINHLMRGDWNGNTRIARPPNARSAPPIPVLDWQLSRPDEVLIPWTLGQGIMSADEHFSYPLRISSPAWLPQDTVAVALSAGEYWLLRFTPSDLVVEVRGAAGQIIGNFAFSEQFPNLATAPIEVLRAHSAGMTISVLKSRAWVSIFDHLFCFSGVAGEPKQWHFSRPVLGLEQSCPFLSKAIVARCKEGVAVFWADQVADHQDLIATELTEPLAAFLRNGALVLLSTSAGMAGFAGRVIDLDRRGIHSTADFTWRGDFPVALVATDDTDGFAVFTKAGDVSVFRVPVGKWSEGVREGVRE